MDSYSQDRLLSCGLDRQVIFWKVNEDSELVYKNEKHTTDTINVINNTGSQIKASKTVTQDGQVTLVNVLLDAVARDVGGIKTVLKGL